MCDSDHWTILLAIHEGGMLAGVAHKGPFERIHIEMFLRRNLVSVLDYCSPSFMILT